MSLHINSVNYEWNSGRESVCSPDRLLTIDSYVIIMHCRQISAVNRLAELIRWTLFVSEINLVAVNQEMP